MSQIAILDGTGGGKSAKVDDEFRLHGNSIITSPLEHASDKYGDAAMWTSTYAATAGQEVIAIENREAERHLRISRLRVFSTVDTLWSLLVVTGGTPAGTTITYVNPNVPSGVQRSESSFGNASVTGSVVGSNILLANTLAEVMVDIYLEGAIVLGNTDGIAVTVDATGTVGVSIMGFWERPS